MKASAVLISCFLLGILAPDHALARPLTKSEHDTFVRDFTSTCVSGSHVRAMIKSHGGGSSQLRQYCSCAGDYFASHLSYEQAMRPSGNYTSMHEAAYNHCVKKVFH